MKIKPLSASYNPYLLDNHRFQGSVFLFGAGGGNTGDSVQHFKAVQHFPEGGVFSVQFMSVLVDDKELGTRAVEIIIPGHGNSAPFMGKARIDAVGGELPFYGKIRGAVTGIIPGTALDYIARDNPVEVEAVIKTRQREIDKIFLTVNGAAAGKSSMRITPPAIPPPSSVTISATGFIAVTAPRRRP
jgi:hypothetical protein